MRIIQKLTDNKFLNLFQVSDPENNVKGYQYAERKGTDSVAFICYDRGTKHFLVNKEYKPPTNEFILGAFGGSFDKDKSAIDIVIDEVREEAGFEVTKDTVFPLGEVFVSTQMNQYCHLFLVGVDKNDQLDRRPENDVEAMAETIWIEKSSIPSLKDWKAITIAAKAGLL